MFSQEMTAKLRILGRNAHRTRVQIAFPHHDTAQDDEQQRAETELLGSEQSHKDDVASGFQLAVHLQADITSQPVLH